MLRSGRNLLSQRIIPMRAITFALGLTAMTHIAQADCQPIDFLTLALPQSGDPVEIALEAAYPGADIDTGAGTFRTPDGTVIPYAPARNVDPGARLDDATLGDMFINHYPLDFDLTARQTAWFDPGRVRNEAFFQALYFDNEASASASLTTVIYTGPALRTTFAMTTKNCVATQLAAVLAQIEGMAINFDPYFDQAGGSFNWRVIAGTDRMSSHSFGTAIDINTELGGYWRWTGVAEGQVTDYDNKIPENLVREFERFGFIWGGKWNHFDGMHFEYRPEMILYGRLEN